MRLLGGAGDHIHARVDVQEQRGVIFSATSLLRARGEVFNPLNADIWSIISLPHVSSKHHTD